MNFFLKIFKFLPPEFAHSASLNSLNLLHKFKLLVLFRNKIINKNKHTIFGMKFRNKLGTAAGLDKNGDYIDALGALGFGFLEVGTVTPKPQYGNPKPRIYRNYQENSIINRLGFNNKGIDYLVNNLKKRNLLSITFTTTKDLDACFPASIARKFNGLDSVAFLDCQQMYVPNDMDFCIRLMAQALLPSIHTVNHPYLRGASKLRSDRC